MTNGGVMKIPAFALVAVLAMVVAGCGGGSHDSAAPVGPGTPIGTSAADAGYQAAGGGGASFPGITVTGSGSARTVPDVSDWSFGVEADADTATAALRDAAQATRRIIGALRNAGVSKRDLRTEQVSLYPRMADDGRTVTGYSASSSVAATVRDIGKAGHVVDAAVAAGANQVSGPMLSVSDSKAQYQAAVAAALDDARSRAQAIADKAGVTLGQPVAIIENGGGGYPVPAYADALRAAAVPIEPGTQEISATLTVTFAIS
jgi:uncharacterized protein